VTCCSRTTRCRRSCRSRRRSSGTGIVDSTGKRHKIGAYLSLDHTNLSELYQALYLFEVVGIGFVFPETAMDQFNQGKPWDVVPGAKINGAHYVCAVAKRQNIDVVTWGALQKMTGRFFRAYCDEAWTYVSNENLKSGKSPEGFNLAQLKADLTALEAGQV
jgi:hypothetical protein